MSFNRLTRGRGLLGSLNIGGGTALGKAAFYSVSFSTALSTSLSANVTASMLFAVTGIVTGETIIGLNPVTGFTSGIGLAGHRISAADEIAITFVNASGGVSTGLASDYKIWTLKNES